MAILYAQDANWHGMDAFDDVDIWKQAYILLNIALQCSFSRLVGQHSDFIYISESYLQQL
jgi:hypothetical protein